MTHPGWLEPLVTAIRAEGSDADLLPGRPTMPDGTAPRRSAVLILFGEQAHGPDVLLIQRAATLSSHAGQPAFPGGASDPGDDGPVDTALREAEEEVGLLRSGVAVAATMPEIWVPPSGFVVRPVVGWWHTPSPVAPMDPGEVARVERVAVAALVDPANRFRVRHPSGYVGPAFAVADLLVWGFTGMVLDWVLDAAGWSRPWDERDVRPLPPDQVPAGPEDDAGGVR